MLSREFTTKEKVLLVVCVILAVGILWYQLVYRGVDSAISRYSTEQLQTELDTETAKAVRISQMKQVIANSEGKEHGEIQVYNNLVNEVSKVGEILGDKADNIRLTWNDPIGDGTTVRRVVNVSFQTDSYDHLKEILNAFNECEYRLLIGDLTVSGTYVDLSGTDGTAVDEPGIEGANLIAASFDVTFFETTDGAATTAGIVYPEESSATDSDAVEAAGEAAEARGNAAAGETS